MTEGEGVGVFAVDLHVGHHRELHPIQILGKRRSQIVLVLFLLLVVVVVVLGIYTEIRIPTAGRPDAPTQAPGARGRVQQKGPHPHLPRQHQCRRTRSV